MAIASRKPAAAVNTQPSLPKIQPEAFKGIVYDDNNKPLHSLIAYIAGAPWTVNYYQQVVGEHNDLREVDPGQPGTYQQYQKTIKLEIRVRDTLSTSYDTERGITTVRGTGILYPFMVPNNADYFIAEASDNQQAIFRITQVERATFNRDSVFTIDYELVGYVDTKREIYNDLESKVIRTYHFSKDRLVEGLTPTIKTEEYQNVINLKSVYKELVQYYFKSFFDRQYSTLVIPGQSTAFYDPYLVAFLTKIVDTFDAPEVRLIKQIPTDKDVYMSQPQFWDLLATKDYTGKAYSNNMMGLVNKELFNKNSYVQGLALSNIKYVVYPINPDTSTLIGTASGIKLVSMESLIDTRGQKEAIYSAIDNQYITDTKTYSLIHEVLQDNSYVLSDAFYQATVNQSVLEVLVKDLMKNQTLDLKMLYALISKYRSWKRLEQFYYGPILLTLIKEADRAQYS